MTGEIFLEIQIFLFIYSLHTAFITHWIAQPTIHDQPSLQANISCPNPIFAAIVRYIPIFQAPMGGHLPCPVFIVEIFCWHLWFYNGFFLNERRPSSEVTYDGCCFENCSSSISVFSKQDSSDKNVEM